jgi:folate-binding protein YgfZ
MDRSLQAQTMNDVRALQPRQWQWNGWLSPKGRLHALFAVLRTGDAAFALVVPDMPACELGNALQRYVFRSKVRLGAAVDWQVQGEFAAAGDPGHADMATLAPGGQWTLDMAGGRLMHVFRDAPAGAATDTGLASVGLASVGLASAGGNAWIERDLHHGLPRLPAAQRDAWTPQMLSLQRLHAYSLSKGCYPGQEIVARTHYLGQAKRSLHLLAGNNLVSGGEVRDEAGKVVGSIICADPHSRLALAVLGVFDHESLLLSGGSPAREVELADGLQRPL